MSLPSFQEVPKSYFSFGIVSGLCPEAIHIGQPGEGEFSSQTVLVRNPGQSGVTCAVFSVLDCTNTDLEVAGGCWDMSL